jgi:Phosphate-selective porin O and P
MTTHVCSVLALCVATAAPAMAGQSAQEAPEPPPPVFELVPEAYIQLDWRSYPEWPVSPGPGRLEFNTFEVRRLRAGVNGQWRGVQFELTFDPQDLDGTLVKDAYAEFRPGSYEIRFGQFKPPGSRDYSTSARQTDFLERAALGRALSAQRDVGVALHGDLGQRFDYDVGLFAGDNNGSTRRSGVTGAGRLEWEPGPDLVLAVYGSEGRLAAVDTDPENGLEGRLSSGYRFFENVYVQGRRTRLGGDVEWSPGRWQFTVEALRVRDERQEQGVDIDDLPSVVGTGASLTTRWRFAPRRDVAVRYEYLGFDDDGPDTDMASVRPRAADLRARAAQAVTFGASLGVTRWVRLMGNAGVEWFSDLRTAPEAGREGAYWTLGTRLQVEFPGILGLGVR